MKNIFRKQSANESLIMGCLQIYREYLSLVTFLRVHSNSKEITYLTLQNKYRSLKTTCHIKPKTKLLKNLLLAKYFKSLAAALGVICICRNFLFSVCFGTSESAMEICHICLLADFRFQTLSIFTLHNQPLLTNSNSKCMQRFL